MIHETDHDKVIRLQEKLESSQIALELARKDIDRRLDEMNELRKQINAERGEFIPRSEYYVKYDSLVEAVNQLQKFQWFITGALLVVQFLLHFWK